MFFFKLPFQIQQSFLAIRQRVVAGMKEGEVVVGINRERGGSVLPRDLTSHSWRCGLMWGWSKVVYYTLIKHSQFHVQGHYARYSRVGYSVFIHLFLKKHRATKQSSGIRNIYGSIEWYCFSLVYAASYLYKQQPGSRQYIILIMHSFNSWQYLSSESFYLRVHNVFRHNI